MQIRHNFIFFLLVLTWFQMFTFIWLIYMYLFTIQYLIHKHIIIVFVASIQLIKVSISLPVILRGHICHSASSRWCQWQRTRLSMQESQETQVQSLGQEEDMASHSIFLPGESHGERRLVGYSPWGSQESDMTERLNTFPFPSLSFHFRSSSNITIHAPKPNCFN